MWDLIIDIVIEIIVNPGGDDTGTCKPDGCIAGTGA